jgi:RimJ/RimL family protein N-acetyltransferase
MIPAFKLDHVADPRPRVSLLSVKDDCHRWLAGRRAASPIPDLILPPSGIATREELEEVWAIARRCRDCRTPASWLIVSDRTAVGLVGYRDPPRKTTEVEIGYRIAESARGKGFARSAVRMLAALAERDRRIVALTARTEYGNLASERVLTHAGFMRVETRLEPELGAVRLWRRRLR